MALYGLPDAGPTTITEWREDISNLLLAHPSGMISNPTHDNFIEAGWLLYVEPVLGVHEKKGVLSFAVANEVTYTVIPWTQEEIDAETAQLAEDALLTQSETDFLTSQFMGVTKAEADTYIESKTADPDLRVLFKKIAYNLVDLNEIVRVKFGIK